MSDSLIYSMSVKGNLSLESFYDILSSATLEGEHDEGNVNFGVGKQVLRILESLGYCEYDYNHRKIFMCKPTFVLLPSSGIPTAALVGARIPKLIDKIKQAVKNEKGRAFFIRVPQKSYGVDIPSLVTIQADNCETLQRIALSCNVEADLNSPGAWKMALFSASINEVRENLLPMLRSRNNQELRVFDENRLLFVQDKEQDARLTEFIDRSNNQRNYWYWEGTNAATINREWGIYLSLFLAEKKVLIYNPRLLELSVPASAPLPTIISRSLSLCTGTSPYFARTGQKRLGDIPENHPLHVFSGIPREIATLAASKVGQDLVKHDGYVDASGVVKA
ncbi:MAG: hypothetical protein M0Z77_10565 [Thermoplasmatales archaeon]|nr:hypothetical protein [Thermoplasmatales archaeon]